MPTAVSNRLFFALWPSAEIRTRIATATAVLSAHHSGGRRLNPARYHLTLKYLGDNVAAPDETAAMNAATQVEAPPFSLRLDQAGCFRNRDIPIWLGPSEIPAELVYLDQVLRRALGERPRGQKLSFAPHLTVMREAKIPLPTVSIEPIEWRVDGFVLIRSVLRPKATYEILQSHPLRGGPAPPAPEQFSLLPE